MEGRERMRKIASGQGRFVASRSSMATSLDGIRPSGNSGIQLLQEVEHTVPPAQKLSHQHGLDFAALRQRHHPALLGASF